MKAVAILFLVAGNYYHNSFSGELMRIINYINLNSHFDLAISFMHSAFIKCEMSTDETIGK